MVFILHHQEKNILHLKIRILFLLHLKEFLIKKREFHLQNGNFIKIFTEIKRMQKQLFTLIQLMQQPYLLTRKILKALNGRKACIIANHGQIAFDKNLPKAFELAEEVENISLQYITALKLGRPKILSLKEMNKVLSKAKNYKRG